MGEVLCGACFSVLGPKEPRRLTRERLDDLKRVAVR